MKARELRPVISVLYLAWLVVSLASCTHVYDIPVHTVTTYSQHDKVDLKVALQVSDELHNAKWERKSMGDTWIIPLGEHLSHNAAIMAGNLFTDVVLQKATDVSPDRVDANLTPKMIFAEQSVGIWAWSEAVLTVALEWTLQSVDGEVIWVDTIKGESKGAGGNAFTHKARAEERIKILIDDIFQKSFQAMASAQAIKDFSRRKRKGVAFNLSPLVRTITLSQVGVLLEVSLQCIEEECRNTALASWPGDGNKIMVRFGVP